MYPQSPNARSSLHSSPLLTSLVALAYYLLRLIPIMIKFLILIKFILMYFNTCVFIAFSDDVLHIPVYPHLGKRIIFLL